MTLYISEYNNMGDVQWETPMEPAQRVHTVEVGEVSDPVDRAARFVVLFATRRMRVAFVPDGDESDAKGHAFPIAAEVETLRLIHMNTGFRLATFPMDDVAPAQNSGTNYEPFTGALQWTPQEIERIKAMNQTEAPPVVTHADAKEEASQ